MRGIKRDVSRRDLIKALGVSGITLGGIGTGVTVATSNDDTDGKKKRCPNDLNIVYTRKHGKWRAHKRHDGVNPKHIRVKGDSKKVKIYAPFPFAVSYATRKKKKKKDKKRDWDDEKKDDKHDRNDEKKEDHDRHRRFKDCKKQKPVRAESTDSIYCATVKADGKRKGKKKKICWFRIRCPKKNDDKHDRKRSRKDGKKHDKKRDWDDDWKDDRKDDKKDKEGC